VSPSVSVISMSSVLLGEVSVRWGAGSLVWRAVDAAVVSSPAPPQAICVVAEARTATASNALRRVMASP
jgi:hypothetical protein